MLLLMRTMTIQCNKCIFYVMSQEATKTIILFMSYCREQRWQSYFLHRLAGGAMTAIICFTLYCREWQQWLIATMEHKILQATTNLLIDADQPKDCWCRNPPGIVNNGQAQQQQLLLNQRWQSWFLLWRGGGRRRRDHGCGLHSSTPWHNNNEQWPPPIAAFVVKIVVDVINDVDTVIIADTMTMTINMTIVAATMMLLCWAEGCLQQITSFGWSVLRPCWLSRLFSKQTWF